MTEDTNMTTIENRLERIHADVIATKTDMSWVKKELEGNGKEGLIGQTDKNTKYRIESETKDKLLKAAIGSGWAITLVLLILTMTGVI